MCMVYADDVHLCAETQEELRDMLQSLGDELSKCGLSCPPTMRLVGRCETDRDIPPLR